MARYIILLLLGSLFFTPAIHAQELQCNISINASQIQSDKTVFDDMRQAITRYLNDKKWTNDVFGRQERIRCNLQIIVQQRPTPDYFSCRATLQVYRPVYNSTYETLLVNVADRVFNFTYVAFQPMNYVENAYTDNLTSLLNFYAYIILGFDYDSFSPSGGEKYFRKAREIVDLAAASSIERGWKAAEDNRNRYWLVENLQNSRYRGFHTVLYKYHRQGLDQMEDNPANARRAIIESLKEMQRISRQNPLLMLTKAFLDAKDDEIVQVFMKAFVNDKKEFIAVMQELDPSNMAEYKRVMTSN